MARVWVALSLDQVRQALDGGIGGDLQGLARTCVLGVLEDFLLASAAPDEIEWGLSEGQHLPDDALEDSNA